MARSIKFLFPNSQVSGLTGRLTRTPLVEKYGDRIFRGIARTDVPEPTLADPVKKPPVETFDEMGGGPGIGPGEGAVGGIEAGSTFGDNPDPVAAGFEQTAMANMPVSSIFGAPVVAGVKGGLSAAMSGMNLSQIAQSAFAPALMLGLLNTTTKAPIMGANARTAAQAATDITSGLPQDEALNIAGITNSLVTDPTTSESPQNQALTTNPMTAQLVNVFNEQRKAPRTLTSLAVKNIKDALSNTPNQGNAPVTTGIDASVAGGLDLNGAPAQGVDTSVAGSLDLGGNPNAGIDASVAGGFDFGGGNANPAGSQPGALGVNSPSGGDGGGSPTALCTSLYRQGLMAQEIYIADVNYSGTLDKEILDGYYVWAKHVAKLMDKSKVVTFILKWPITQWAKNMAFWGSGARVGRPTKFGKFIEFVGFPICRFVGRRI